MVKWIANLFEPKERCVDIVRFIRTEYHEDTKHLNDDDIIHYYEYITRNKRRI